MSEHEKAIEAAAMTLCWSGFWNPSLSHPGETAKTYWRKVHADSKARYRQEARAIVAAFLGVCRVSDDVKKNNALEPREIRLIQGVMRITADEVTNQQEIPCV